MRISLEEALQQVDASMLNGGHCGPTVMKVMSAAYGFNNPDFLWAGMALRGGLAGVQAGPCGAIAASLVCLGLRHRHPLDDTEQAEREDEALYEESQELVKGFVKEFGALSCRELTGIDFDDPEASKVARESGLFSRICPGHVKYVVEQLYRIESVRDAGISPSSG